ncbi:Gfo/Idh/MocA family oxidoreductase [Polyangium sp. 6x1]|uniref:Gfo/Idh/MocA family protein n=1 Tax=Polyangium sp. 6x1 TaxID=3042689 RepID=UPI0024832D6E|nr:Gfo/Idh/MocA family oxidoreductase [Polyangium sp. 6x1]MDI1451412.1 Gfo/Idh/MocA family oxidoreductase [Polyangium sp. 6x1]
MTVPVALVGCGAWGENLLRVLCESPRAELVAVAETSAARRELARAKAPSAAIVESLEEAIGLGARAVVIATPPRSHASLVLTALDAGLDVLVEKPLALSAADAERCMLRAASLGRVAMVGHLLRYHPAVERLVAMVHEGALGTIRHLAASRLSIRGDRSVPALWSLGPHDLSIVHAIEPLRIDALEATSGPEGDPVVLDLRLASGFAARIELSRVHATKERRIVVVGSSAVAMLDDVRAPDRVFLSRQTAAPSAALFEGPTEEIRVPWREPMAVEIDHFLRCVEERRAPRTSFEEGTIVVRALERAERVLGEAVPRPASLPAEGS